MYPHSTQSKSKSTTKSTYYNFFNIYLSKNSYQSNNHNNKKQSNSNNQDIDIEDVDVNQLSEDELDFLLHEWANMTTTHKPKHNYHYHGRSPVLQGIGVVILIGVMSAACFYKWRFEKIEKARQGLDNVLLN